MGVRYNAYPRPDSRAGPARLRIGLSLAVLTALSQSVSVETGQLGLPFGARPDGRGVHMRDVEDPKPVIRQQPDSFGPARDSGARTGPLAVALRGLGLLGLLLLAACTLKGYSGETLPAEELAVVDWSWPSGVRVKSLDGELPGASSRAMVLPGEHIVNFTYSSNFGLTTYSATLTFEAEAGKVYRLQASCHGLVSCEPFWAWVEEAESEIVVAGKSPN